MNYNWAPPLDFPMRSSLSTSEVETASRRVRVKRALRRAGVPVDASTSDDDLATLCVLMGLTSSGEKK